VGRARALPHPPRSDRLPAARRPAAARASPWRPRAVTSLRVILLEFAAQGVRGVAPAGGRVTLRPGYNVLSADGPTLRRLVEALLYPDPRDGDALPRAAGGPANAPMRAGLTLVGNDKITYRIVRDFASGAQLQRFDPAKRSFASVAQDLGEITAFLQRTVGVPPPQRLGTLLALSAAELPSRSGGVAPQAAAPPQRQSLTPEQTRKRLALLREELGKAKVAEKLQYQLDGLQTQLFKIEEALKGGAKVREGLEKAEAARAELGDAAAVAASLGDADAKLAAFEKATVRKEDAAARVRAEREALAETETRGEPLAFWKDPRFWAGAGGGAGLALAGAVGAATVNPELRYLSILDVPAFGWAAWVALRWVGGLEGWERVARRTRIVDEWERKVGAQFEKDAADVREAVKALRVSSPGELKEALARVADADAVVAEWRSRLADWEASPEAKRGLGEQSRVEEALRGVEEKLAGEAGGFVRDVRSVESEIQRLEAEATAPVASQPAPAPAPAPVHAPRASGDPIRGLLERAATELGRTPPAVARAVAQRASAVVSGLSFQRLQAMQADDRGNVQVQIGGRPVASLSLSPADKDMVFVALKLALMEQAMAGGKLVAVADDAFAGFSEGSRRHAARLLKQIAKTGQILHATSDASFREAADHAG
jgi:hypothetical protein